MTAGVRFEMRKATLHLGERRLAGASGVFDVHFFRDLARDATAMAISTGAVDGAGSPLLARVHSSCVTSECLMGRDCDCAEQLEGALATMAAAGRGVVFYLLQEGRGAGLTAKARDRMMVQASGDRITTFDAYRAMGLPTDLRDYEGVASMARLLGVRAPIRLLTNNPEKLAAVGAALATEKIALAGAEAVHGVDSPFNRHYLDAKQATGHGLGLGTAGAAHAARPPVRPVVIDPFAVRRSGATAEECVATACYYLPVALGRASDAPGPPTEPTWFRTTVLYDRATARESMVLAWADPDEAVAVGRAELVRRIERDVAGIEGRVELGLLDRLPFREATLDMPTSTDADVGTGWSTAPAVVRTDGRARVEVALSTARETGVGSVEVGFDERDRASA